MIEMLLTGLIIHSLHFTARLTQIIPTGRLHTCV